MDSFFPTQDDTALPGLSADHLGLNGNEEPFAIKVGGVVTVNGGADEERQSILTNLDDDERIYTSGGNTLTQSLASTDQNQFTIDDLTGAVVFKQSPDYKKPANSDLNNVYQETVTVTDNGGLSNSKPKLKLKVEQSSTLPTITVATTDRNARETKTGVTPNPGRFTLTRTGDLTKALTVNYTLSGTATKGVDYNNLTGEVTFAVGSSTALVNVNPIHDTLTEGKETAILTLATGAGYTLGTTKTGTVNIADNKALPTITVATIDGNAGETKTGVTPNPGQFALNRTGSTTKALTVNYTLTGTAFKEDNSNNSTEKITFPVGSATVLVNINPTDDTLTESSETVILTLATGTGYILGTTKTGTVNVADNDELLGVTLVNKPEEGLFEIGEVLENGEVVIDLFENGNSQPIFSRYVNQLGELLKTISYQDNGQRIETEFLSNGEQIITVFSDELLSERQYINQSGFLYKVQNFEPDNINTEIEFNPNGEKIVSFFNINPSTSENIYLTSQFLDQNGKITQFLEYKYFVLQSSPPEFIRSISKQIDYNPITEKITSISINSFKDSSGNVVFQSRQDFDSQERLVKTTEFNFDGSVKSEIITQYFSDGLIINDTKEGDKFTAQQIFQTINGKQELVSSSKFIYDGNGVFEKTIETIYEENLIIVNTYNIKQLAYEQVFEITDSGTRLLSTTEFSSSDNDLTETSILYRENGEQYISIGKDGQLTQEQTIDTSGRLKELITYETVLGLPLKTIITYEYDGSYAHYEGKSSLPFAFKTTTQTFVGSIIVGLSEMYYDAGGLLLSNKDYSIIEKTQNVVGHGTKEVYQQQYYEYVLKEERQYLYDSNKSPSRTIVYFFGKDPSFIYTKITSFNKEGEITVEQLDEQSSNKVSTQYIKNSSSSKYVLREYLNVGANQYVRYDENGNIVDSQGNPINQEQAQTATLNLISVTIDSPDTGSKFVNNLFKGDPNPEYLKDDVNALKNNTINNLEKVPIVGDVIKNVKESNNQNGSNLLTTAALNEIKILGEKTFNEIEDKLNIKIPELSFPNIPTTPQEFQEAINSLEDLLIPDFVSGLSTSIGNSLPPGTIPIIPKDFADVGSVFEISKEVAEKYIEISPTDFVQSVKDTVGEIPTPQEAFESLKNGFHDATDVIDQQIIQPFSQYAIDEALNYLQTYVSPFSLGLEIFGKAIGFDLRGEWNKKSTTIHDILGAVNNNKAKAANSLLYFLEGNFVEAWKTKDNGKIPELIDAGKAALNGDFKTAIDKFLSASGVYDELGTDGLPPSVTGKADKLLKSDNPEDLTKNGTILAINATGISMKTAEAAVLGTEGGYTTEDQVHAILNILSYYGIPYVSQIALAAEIGFYNAEAQKLLFEAGVYDDTPLKFDLPKAEQGIKKSLTSALVIGKIQNAPDWIDAVFSLREVNFDDLDSQNSIDGFRKSIGATLEALDIDNGRQWIDGVFDLYEAIANNVSSKYIAAIGNILEAATDVQQDISGWAETFWKFKDIALNGFSKDDAKNLLIEYGFGSNSAEVNQVLNGDYTPVYKLLVQELNKSLDNKINEQELNSILNQVSTNPELALKTSIKLGLSKLLGSDFSDTQINGLVDIVWNIKNQQYQEALKGGFTLVGYGSQGNNIVNALNNIQNGNYDDALQGLLNAIPGAGKAADLITAGKNLQGITFNLEFDEKKKEVLTALLRAITGGNDAYNEIETQLSKETTQSPQ